MSRHNRIERASRSVSDPSDRYALPLDRLFRLAEGPDDPGDRWQAEHDAYDLEARLIERRAIAARTIT